MTEIIEAALELTIAPPMPDMREQVIITDVDSSGSPRSAPDSIGLITVKLAQILHNPPILLQLPGIYNKPIQQMAEMEERISAVEITPPSQNGDIGSLVAAFQQSAQSDTKNLVSGSVVINSDERSNFVLFSE